jgi:hypothetical protein
LEREQAKRGQERGDLRRSACNDPRIGGPIEWKPLASATGRVGKTYFYLVTEGLLPLHNLRRRSGYWPESLRVGGTMEGGTA